LEQQHIITARQVAAIVGFLRGNLTMDLAEDPVNLLRSLPEFTPPKSAEEGFRELLDCRLSGQIDDAGWVEHLKDDGLRDWLKIIA
jgi:hypothetical protein